VPGSKTSFLIPGLPGGPVTLAKNGMSNMAAGLLEPVQPSNWNNIPIPICEGFEVVTQAIKKIATQLEINFEAIRRREDRADQDIQRIIADINSKSDQRHEKLGDDLQVLRDSFNSFSAATDLRLIHHNEKIEEIFTKCLVEINEKLE
jgi:hypothetical protein